MAAFNTNGILETLQREMPRSVMKLCHVSIKAYKVTLYNPNQLEGYGLRRHCRTAKPFMSGYEMD